jgi:hypothetical protein
MIICASIQGLKGQEAALFLLQSNIVFIFHEIVFNVSITFHSSFSLNSSIIHSHISHISGHGISFLTISNVSAIVWRTCLSLSSNFSDSPSQIHTFKALIKSFLGFSQLHFPFVVKSKGIGMNYIYYIFSGIIICLKFPGSAFLDPSSRIGSRRIGASGLSNWSETCVVSMTPRASRK